MFTVNLTICYPWLNALPCSVLEQFKLNSTVFTVFGKRRSVKMAKKNLEKCFCDVV